MAEGHRGNESTLLLMLADVYALDGRVEEARQHLRQARDHPGPYRGLMKDIVDARLRDLDAPA